MATLSGLMIPGYLRPHVSRDAVGQVILYYIQDVTRVTHVVSPIATLHSFRTPPVAPSVAYESINKKSNETGSPYVGISD
jgi:hypothetical protein